MRIAALTMLFDLTNIDDATANHSLECMCKSLSEPPAGDEGIWALHDSPYLQALVEGFTQQGQNTFAAMAGSLEQWLAGANHVRARRVIVKNYQKRMVQILLSAINVPDTKRL